MTHHPYHADPPSRLACVRRFVLITLTGVAGVAAAVVLSLAASHLTNEDIGLNNEPLTAGRKLVPAAAVPAATTPRPATTTTTTAAPPKQQAVPPAATWDSEPGDDSGGHSRDKDGDADD